MMTEEERQRLQAELLRKQQEQVAMLSQSSMTPEELAAAMQQSGYDPAGKEAMLASMLRGGQDAVFSDMPQGRMMGNVYAAPNWAESLNGAASKLVGGYQMGQARKEQTAIDEKRALSKTAAAKLAAETARKEQLATAQGNLGDMLTAEQTAAMAERRLQQTADIAAARERGANARLTRTIDAKNSAPPKLGTTVSTFQLPDGRIVNTRTSGSAIVDATTLQPVDLTGAVKYSAPDTAATQKQVNTDTRNLSKDLAAAGVPRAKIALQETLATLAPFANEDGGYSKVPGIGYMQNTPVVGSALTMVEDAVSTDDTKPSGKAVRQNFQKLMNAEIKLESGATVTVQEALRQNLGSGFNMFAGEEEFSQGMKTLAEIIASTEENVLRGYSDEAREAYASRNVKPSTGTGGLTPEEQAELAELEKRYGGRP